MQLALANHRLVHDGLGSGVHRQGVETLLVEHGKNGHERHLIVVSPLEHDWIGRTSHQAVLIHLIPGGHQHIDLRGVCQEGSD